MPDEHPRAPVALQRFLELYGENRFWDSHEALEDEWRRTGSAFYQGLILYASAWVHWERANAHGVRAQLAKALGRLEGYPDSYLGIDVDALRGHCVAVREKVENDRDGWADQVAGMRISFAPDRFRGDEAELQTDG